MLRSAAQLCYHGIFGVKLCFLILCYGVWDSMFNDNGEIYYISLQTRSFGLAGVHSSLFCTQKAFEWCMEAFQGEKCT